MGKWIGVDLDGTLAEYHGSMGKAIGRPILPMLEMVQALLRSGIEVRIFTARASDPGQLPAIRQWLASHGLAGCPVTNMKDFNCHLIVDDRAARAVWNRGEHCPGCRGEALRRMEQLGLKGWPTSRGQSLVDLL